MDYKETEGTVLTSVFNVTPPMAHYNGCMTQHNMSDDHISMDNADVMRAWRLRDQPGPITTEPLEYVESAIPVPQPGEALIKVLACGVCRTDLHVSEGDLPVHVNHVTPGHEIVGRVVAIGPTPSEDAFGAANHVTSHMPTIEIGDRVGVAWLRHTCGQCEFCRNGKENLCRQSLYTGWDANGGYAQYTTAPLDYVYPLEPLLNGSEIRYAERTIAPLLCAGIIGYRALKRTGLLDDYDPDNSHAVRHNGRTPVLGLYGFGGSAHITAQVALALGMRVHVLTRGEDAKRLALSLGCSSANDAYDMPPELLDAAIIFAPVGAIVPPALDALRSGGVLSLAGIHMSDIPALNYEREVFHEKEIRSVESNTRQDGREFLTFAGKHQLNLDTHVYALQQAQQALIDLKSGAFAGAAVLVP